MRSRLISRHSRHKQRICPSCQELAPRLRGRDTPHSNDQVDAHEAPPGLSGVTDIGNGKLIMSVESWIGNVAQDLPESEARLLAAVQTPLGVSTFSDTVSQAAWLDRPTYYVVSSEDRAVNVELQRALAVKMEAKTIELEASHMSLLSAPADVAEVIYDAVITASV